MEGFNSGRLRAMPFVLVLASAMTGVIVSSCGSEAGRTPAGVFGRRELGSPAEVASSNDTLTVAVRYLAFTNSSGVPVAARGAVEKMVDHMTKIWSRCNIGFRLETYQETAPASIPAPYNPGTYRALDKMRMDTQTDLDLVIIGTGTWGRANDLGSSNCYSSFPGDAADGIVCEAKSAASPVIMAHEVGHWLNLRHTDNASADGVDDTNSGNVRYNLMNHVVAPSNDSLTDGQCFRARSAIAEYRRNAVI